jgi:hypothetical protein
LNGRSPIIEELSLDGFSMKRTCSYITLISIQCVNAIDASIYRTLHGKPATQYLLSNPNSKRHCYVQYRGKICLCFGRKAGVSDQPSALVEVVELLALLANLNKSFSRALSSTPTLTPPRHHDYLSLNTFGFHPSCSSASLLAASSAFRTSLSIRSLALRTLLCR